MRLSSVDGPGSSRIANTEAEAELASSCGQVVTAGQLVRHSKPRKPYQTLADESAKYWKKSSTALYNFFKGPAQTLNEAAPKTEAASASVERLWRRLDRTEIDGEVLLTILWEICVLRHRES